MKCLIIAAGRGSRLWRRGRCKPLVPVLGVPLIERVIRTASNTGVTDFYVVTGHEGECLRFFLSDLARRLPHIHIHSIENPDWQRGNGTSVLSAKDHLQEPFFLLMCDHLFDSAIMADLCRQPPPENEVILAVDYNVGRRHIKKEDVTRVASNNGRVRDIGKGLASYNGFDTGVFLCSSVIFEALEQNANNRAELNLTDGIRRLAAEGLVRAVDIGGKFWVDVDEPGDLLRAENELLKQVRHKPHDGMVARYVNRPLSVRISKRIARTSITPNQVTVLSFLLAVIGAAFFTIKGYLAMLLGGLLSQAASIVDGCDGELARLKYCESEYGGWLDAVLDRYADGMLLLALTWRAQSEVRPSLAFLVGFLAIIGSFLVSYTAGKYDALRQERLDSRLTFRIGRDLRIFIIFIGAFLNQAFLTLLAITVVMNLETIRRLRVFRRYLFN
ncbi:MAG: NTP transferase domain-containing protein [Deltaproteobacteria bacterium]|nr:NTP transferase domain-containing protein [Deltaproteobacteria bacterium]MBW2072748.1 NTP transferase domain-containing protein [Deltaproteobacteria bacterium]